MSVTAMASPEVAVFRDVPLDRLEILSSLGARALTALEGVDRMLQAAEEPMPVLSVSVNHVRTLGLPSIWMGLGRTEPGRGLQYAQDTEYIPRPSAPSEQIPVHGLEIPVAHGSVSSVKFFPFALRDRGVEVPETWWEHWQRHRFTQQAGDYKHVRDYEDELGFPPFATWFKPSPAQERFRQAFPGMPARELLPQPIIVHDDPDATEAQLIPTGEHGHFFDNRHQAAIFVGEYAVQAVLSDSSRIGVPKELATEPFHAMMTTVANELSLNYVS